MKRASPATKETKSSQPPRVAVLVDTATTWGRQIHRGIHRYDLKHGPWHIFLEARGTEELLRVPTGWKADGVIARIGRLEMAQELKALNLNPAVGFYQEQENHRWTQMDTDSSGKQPSPSG